MVFIIFIESNMNLQEHIRRILTEIEEDRVQIRLGRSAERHFGKVQNIIIMVDDQDITSEDNVPGLGKMNIVIKDGEIIVGDIFIPEKYRKQGIATTVYQKISDYFGLPIVNSKTKGFNQTMEGGYIWKKRNRFEPRNLQEHIRKVLHEETKIPMMLIRRLHYLDDEVQVRMRRFYTPKDICGFRSGEELLEVISNDTTEEMYYTYFSDVDDKSKEWGMMYRTMIEYINDKYGDKIKEYYHINCGN